MNTTTYDLSNRSGSKGLWERAVALYRKVMPESSDSVLVKVLIAFVGALSGIVATALFLWITFPRNLATHDDVAQLSTQMQKQIDEDHASAETVRLKQETDEVLLGRLIEKLGLRSSLP